jgi:regulator of sigma E protease
MFESIYALLSQSLGYLVPMIVLLGLLIFVHELGHFLAAKFYKVRVETFSLGFGPKIIKFIYGDTTYCVSALPLGGYVKMFGDEPGKDIPEEQKRQSYLHKPVGQRIVIVLAGPLMNLFFAYFLFMGVAAIGDKALAPEVGEIALNSEAYKLGLRPYDKILKINDELIETWDEVSEIIEVSGEKLLLFQIERLGEKLSLEIKPEMGRNDNLFSTAEKIGKIKGLNSNLHLPIVGVKPQSNFAAAGFKTGDRIVEINGEPVKWFKDIRPMLLEALFNGSGLTSVKVERFQDFRERDNSKEFNIDVQAVNFKDQSLGIFAPDTVIAEVEPDSPAAKAGLQRFDRIQSINGNEIISFDDIVQFVSSYNQGDDPLKIQVVRDQQEQVFEMIPQMNELEGRFGEKEQRFTIGVIPTLFVAPQTYLWKSTDWGSILQRSNQQTWHWTKVTLLSFVRILQNRVSSKNVSGIISIGQVAQQSWNIGANAFLKIMAIISINLFILNLLPIPILDGGHLVLFTLEAIKGAPISLKKVEVAQQVGFLILLFLMAFALFNDFTRLFGS